MTTKITDKNISTIANKFVQWQSVIIADGSTATNATAGQGYFIDTTSNTHTINLPSSPSIGDSVAIKDYAGTFATNNLTIGRNGKNIQGVANDSLISSARAGLTLVYVDTTRGWVYSKESNVADLGQVFWTSATGGTVATSGDYKIHTFTGDADFVVSSVGNGPVTPIGGPSNADYLVVAGGGGGGVWAGGGGAGGYRTSFPGGTAEDLSLGTYAVTVGAGGTGNPGPSILSGAPYGTNGSSSIFSTITSTGGGRGGSPGCGFAGGSGGGNCGAGNTPPVSPSQGNSGGTRGGFPGYGGGGGGGAGGVGSNGSTTAGAAGGVGAPNSISGSAVSYAGGGGGGGSIPAGGSPGGAGSPCGTGGAGSGNSTGGAGTTNRGGGGGSGGYAPGQAGGNGGSGIVVIRYKFQ